MKMKMKKKRKTPTTPNASPRFLEERRGMDPWS
jgi:hypothetical protein